MTRRPDDGATARPGDDRPTDLLRDLVEVLGHHSLLHEDVSSAFGRDQQTEGSAFPVASTPENRCRFDLALLVDVAHVLTEHGYPAPGSLVDCVTLQEHLHAFLLGPRS